MNPVYEKLKIACDYIRNKTDFSPRLGLILGSGLGNFADNIDIKASVDYRDIPGMPVSTVPGHRGRFIFGEVRGVPLVAMQGRVHFYEGYPIEDVVMPVRLLSMLGAGSLFLTNAAGGINPAFAPGDLMLITDQISAFVPSPLIGENIDELGTKFPDMSEAYDANMRTAVKNAANRLCIPLREGVYLQTTGPNFETPAEIRAYRALGADAVGMSTACEVIAARHAGMRVCGISCISNMAAGMNKSPLTHEEVQETANMAADNIRDLVSESIYGFFTDNENI